MTDWVIHKFGQIPQVVVDFHSLVDLSVWRSGTAARIIELVMVTSGG